MKFGFAAIYPKAGIGEGCADELNGNSYHTYNHFHHHSK